jgi:A/G-specific adenine glycosylase
LFAVETPLPAGRAQIYALTDSITPDDASGDFAQAMMDLGSSICAPRNPDCPHCPLAASCKARAGGDQERYPIKAAKIAKPLRKGVAYWLQHDDAVLLVRRPPKGLLGGMLAFPGGAWGAQAAIDPPANAAWQDAGQISHIFTHFALDIRLLGARISGVRPEGLWWPVAEINAAGLPTVFAKLAAKGRAWQEAA